MSRTRWGTGTPEAFAVLLTLTLTGCATVERACTEIGADSGLNVTVAPALAAGFSDLDLEVCQREACTTHRAASLMPGSVSVDQGCSGSGADDSCSASASPDGSLVGFVPVAGLTAGDLAVTATYSRAGSRHTTPRANLAAVAHRPNGPGCEPEVVQARLQLSGNGLS